MRRQEIYMKYNNNGHTPLHAACINGNIDIVRNENAPEIPDFLSDDFVLANVLNDLSFLLPHQLYHSLTHLKTTAIDTLCHVRD
jgi:hypothetical protein